DPTPPVVGYAAKLETGGGLRREALLLSGRLDQEGAYEAIPTVQMRCRGSRHHPHRGVDAQRGAGLDLSSSGLVISRLRGPTRRSPPAAAGSRWQRGGDPGYP